MPLLRKMLLPIPAGISLRCGQSNMAKTCLYSEDLSMEQRYVEIPTAQWCRLCPEMHGLTICGMAHLRPGILMFSGPLSVISSPQKTRAQADMFQTIPFLIRCLEVALAQTISVRGPPPPAKDRSWCPPSLATLSKPLQPGDIRSPFSIAGGRISMEVECNQGSLT